MPSKKPGGPPPAKSKVKKLTSHKDAMAWAMEAGVTLHCTEGHVLARFNSGHHIGVIGADLVDAINALRSHPGPRALNPLASKGAHK